MFLRDKIRYLVGTCTDLFRKIYPTKSVIYLFTCNSYDYVTSCLRITIAFLQHMNIFNQFSTIYVLGLVACHNRVEKMMTGNTCLRFVCHL